MVSPRPRPLKCSLPGIRLISTSPNQYRWKAQTFIHLAPLAALVPMLESLSKREFAALSRSAQPIHETQIRGPRRTGIGPHADWCGGRFGNKVRPAGDCLGDLSADPYLWLRK